MAAAGGGCGVGDQSSKNAKIPQYQRNNRRFKVLSGSSQHGTSSQANRNRLLNLSWCAGNEFIALYPTPQPNKKGASGGSNFFTRAQYGINGSEPCVAPAFQHLMRATGIFESIALIFQPSTLITPGESMKEQFICWLRSVLHVS